MGEGITDFIADPLVSLLGVAVIAVGILSVGPLWGLALGLGTAAWIGLAEVANRLKRR